MLLMKSHIHTFCLFITYFNKTFIYFTRKPDNHKNQGFKGPFWYNLFVFLFNCVTFYFNFNF